MSPRKHAAARARRQSRQHNWILIGVIVVVVIAMVAAIAISRSGSNNTAKNAAGPQTRPVTVTGAPLPSYASSGADPAVGQTIPTLTGADFAGNTVSVKNDGKPKVLLFAAHWCPHCQREVPLLASALHSDPLPAGVEMFTVSTGVDAGAPNYPPSKWLAGVRWPTPVIADDSNSSAAQAFGLSAYPYFVFVDAGNKVVARTSGEIPVSQFRSSVNELLTAK